LGEYELGCIAPALLASEKAGASRILADADRHEMGNSQKEGPLSAEVLDKFSELITTALGLVAALAWNEAIQQLFTQLFGEAGGALAAKYFYAFIVTLIVIVATISVSRAAERAKRLEAERDRGLLGLGRSKE
jgi:magnesium-transporting ATPase (P-type)